VKTLVRVSDFSRFPAARYRSDGASSAEAFREDVLSPVLRTAKYVVVDFSGTRGYASSFLEEAFGGLVRMGFTVQELLAKLSFEGGERTLQVEVLHYIKSAGENVDRG
jgi:hypothetical protein